MRKSQNIIYFTSYGHITALNTEIPPNFMVWKFCRNAKFTQSRPKLCEDYAFPQKFYNSKLGKTEIYKY